MGKLTRFAKRQIEQSLYAGAVAFGAGLAVPQGSLTKGVLSAALAAALRAVIGAFVRTSGDDPESPSVN